MRGDVAKRFPRDRLTGFRPKGRRLTEILALFWNSTPARSSSVFCQPFMSVRALFMLFAVVPRHLPVMKKPPKLAAFQSLRSGAGEGIRTLDPNLGKVVLYP